MEKYLSHVGASQAATIYWLVFDTNQNTNLFDEEFCAFVTGYYPPFSPAMDSAVNLSTQEKTALAWVREAILDAVMLGDEFRPVMSVRSPVLEIGEEEYVPVLYGGEGLTAPLNSIAISFRRRLYSQEIQHLLTRAQSFAGSYSPEKLIITGYRVIEESRMETCLDVWQDDAKRKEE